ncbi:unnamed protein product [Adineta steineri]|uniref:Protein kinase domain-containing protein n=1 Tax=Adineta steineri TaxID=433720 RepID=A0A815FTP5_9BILA|nr:unnamed protein product [Adineta steineri]CAF3724024.1 unnamed protein product [Adineta steineri]
MTKPTLAELQHEFDKRLKLYNGTNEVSDLWLPYLAAIQDVLPEDNNGENTLANNQILYPICLKCLEKFENNSEQIKNKDFAEICLLIPEMSVDKGLWYGLFYKKQIGVKYAHLWIDWAEYTEENELNWAGAWGIYEEAKKFVIDHDECAEIDKAYRAFADRFQEWDKNEYEKEQSKVKPKNRATVTKRKTQTRSSFEIMMASEPKTKRSPIRAQGSLESDDDPDCQLLPECREAVRLEYSRMLDMSNTSLMGGERVSCIPSNIRRGSIVPPLMNIFTIDQVLRRQSQVPINDTLDENFLDVSCIVVDERDPFDDHIRRQILDKRGINYAIMENYSVEKTNLPTVLSKNKIGTKIEKVKLGGTNYEFGKKLGEGAYGYVITARLESDPKVTYACKIQHPPTVWEFYILTELSRRTIRKAGQFDLNQRIPTVYRLIEYNDYSVMLMQRAPQTLLDFANYHISRDRYVPLCYQLYYSIEMLRIFDYMHRLRIIHCDVKPDNFMVLHCPTTFSTKKASCAPIPSLMLIDFNRSIDLKLFDNGTAFVTCVPKKELACVEMLNNRPWIFQHDLFGMVYSIHVLVFLSYMTVCEDEQRQDGSMTTKAKFSKRIHDIWKEFFYEFLNIPDCQHLPDLNAWADRLELLLFEEAKRIKSKDTDYASMFRMKLDTHLNQFQPPPPPTPAPTS